LPTINGEDNWNLNCRELEQYDRH